MNKGDFISIKAGEKRFPRSKLIHMNEPIFKLIANYSFVEANIAGRMESTCLLSPALTTKGLEQISAQ